MVHGRFGGCVCLTLLAAGCQFHGRAPNTVEPAAAQSPAVMKPFSQGPSNKVANHLPTEVGPAPGVPLLAPQPQLVSVDAALRPLPAVESTGISPPTCFNQSRRINRTQQSQLSRRICRQTLRPLKSQRAHRGILPQSPVWFALRR
jgi:hypothetical protein